MEAREYASGDRLFTNILASAPFASAQLFTRCFAAKQYARIGNPTSHAPELCRLLKCESVTPLHWFWISLNTTCFPLKKFTIASHIVVPKRDAPVQLFPSGFMDCLDDLLLVFLISEFLGPIFWFSSFYSWVDHWVFCEKRTADNGKEKGAFQLHIYFLYYISNCLYFLRKRS